MLPTIVDRRPPASWQRAVADGVSSLAELLSMLELEPEQLSARRRRRGSSGYGLCLAKTPSEAP